MHFPTIYAALLSTFVHTALCYDADFTVYPNAGTLIITFALLELKMLILPLPRL